MTVHQVTIVSADDWHAIYRDGIIYAQGHSLPPVQCLAAAGIECPIIWAQGMADDLGWFPDQLSDVIADKEE